jgi:curved DNA-binding protein CbpA
MLENPYLVLELDGNSSHDISEVKRAYRRLALKYHPDKNPDDPKAEDRFDRIRRAHDYLLDPVTKEEIDSKIKADQERLRRFEEQDEDKKKLARELEDREKRAEEVKAGLNNSQKARMRNAKLLQDMQRQRDMKRFKAQNTARPNHPPLNDIDACIDFGLSITEEQREEMRAEFYLKVDALFDQIKASIH